MIYGTKYRGCAYSKVYEVMDAEGAVITHAYSAKQARRAIDKHLEEKVNPKG